MIPILQDQKMVIETIVLLAFVFAIGVIVVKIYEWRQDMAHTSVDVRTEMGDWPGRTGARLRTLRHSVCMFLGCLIPGSSFWISVKFVPVSHRLLAVAAGNAQRPVL